MTVELAASELAIRGYTPQAFWMLKIPMRRWIASNILRNRPVSDEQSQFAADMMERANPNFNDFVIVSGI